MKIADFCIGIGHGDQIKFANIMSMVPDICSKQTSGNENEMIPRLPICYNDIRSNYVRGPNSICENLPHPQVSKVVSHSYISVKQCIAHHLAYGLSVLNVADNEVDVVNCVGNSRRAVSIKKRALSVNMKNKEDTVPILLNFWSDGFDPNNTNNNRGSVWIFTVTILPNPAHEGKLAYTYPISIGSGSKSSNHDSVQAMFFTEMKELSSGQHNLFFSKEHGNYVRVHAEIFVYLMDQPERRSSNYIMLGNSTYSSQWGKAADIGYAATYLPSCNSCQRNLLAYIHKSDYHNHCDKCSNWDVCSKNGVMSFSPPKDYPISEMGTTDKLLPISLNYEILKAAKSKCHEKIKSGDWTESNGRAYLRVLGINNPLIKNVLDHANNSRRKMQLQAHSNDNFDSIRVDILKNPHLYKEYPHPPFWNTSMDFMQSIDVPMHLLFLGIVKLCIKMFYMWITHTKTKSPFLKYSGLLLSPLIKFNLDYCVLIDIKWDTTKPTTSWVSENYLGFCRIYK